MYYFDPQQLGIPPNMTQYIPLISSMLKEEINGRANANYARGVIYNRVCQQTDANPAFHQFILTVSEHAAMLVDLERKNPTDAIREAVSTTMAITAANIFIKTPGSYNPQDPQVTGEIYAAANMGQQLETRIRDYLMRVRPPMASYPQPQNWNTQQFPQQSPVQYQVTQYPQHQPQYGGFAPVQPNMGSGWSGQGAPMGFGGAPAPVANGPAGSAFASASANNPYVSDTRWTEPVQVAPPVITYVEEPPRQQVIKRRFPIEGQPKAMHDRGLMDEVTFAPSDRTVIDTSGMAVASQQWQNPAPVVAPVATPVLVPSTVAKRTWTELQPHAVVFDPTCNHAYLEEQDGVFVERIGKLSEDDVEYKDHEMDSENRLAIDQKDRDDNPNRVLSVWNGFGKRKVTTDEATEPEIPDVTIKPLYDLDKLTARNLDVALDEAEFAIAELNTADPEAKIDSYVFEYVNRTPMPIDSPELETALIDINECDDLYDLVKLLLVIKPLIAPVWWKTINTTLTRFVNDVLKHRMGLPVTIDDFMDDWNDLASYLETKYGTYVAEVFLTTHRHILVAFKDGMSFNRPEGDSERFTSVRWQWAELVAVVPVSYAEVRVACNESSGLVIPGNTPEFWNALRNLLDRPTNYKSVWTRTLVTNDGMQFRIHQGYFDETAVILEFVVKPE
jgi:hypothetical protein